MTHERNQTEGRCGGCGKAIRGNKNKKWCSADCRIRPKVPKTEGRCQRCGKAFRGNKGKKWCSQDCRPGHTSRYPLKLIHVNVCGQCGKRFVPDKRRPRQEFCGKSCASKSHPLIPTPKPCPTCGTSFTGSNKYCSQNCADLAFQQTKTQCVCAACGNVFLGLGAKHCSPACYMRQRYGAAPWYVPQPRVTRVCVECGNGFQHRATVLYCSVKCGRAVHSRRRRALNRRAFVEHVYMYVLMMRDNGICGLCGKPVDFTQQWPHPMSPSIDHIIPLCKNGKHSYANCQLAHAVCNIRKGGN